MNEQDLNFMVGEIRADVGHIKKATTAIEVKVDSMQKSLIEHKGAIKTAHERLDSMSSLVDNHEKLKQRGWGVAIAFGAIGGLLVKKVAAVLGIVL